MNQKELKELIEFLKEQDIAEFELERGDVKVRIKRALPAEAAPETRFVAIPAAAPAVHEVPMAPHPTGPAGPAGVPKEPPSPPPAAEDGLHVVRSPIVGTFYESPSPGA